MKSIILYGSALKLTNAHKLVTVPPRQVAFFVRAELTPYDAAEAMNHAHLLPGENLLNTQPIIKKLTN